MRTPAGTECPFYYADFHRGHHTQECRIITPAADPRLILANACPNLVLEGQVVNGPLGIGKRLRISASCTRSLKPVETPEIGCGLCHQPLPEAIATPETDSQP
jgi:hypothetical protein